MDAQEKSGAERHTTTHIQQHHVTYYRLTNVVYKKLTFVVITHYWGVTHVAIQKYDIVHVKKTRYLRILGAKKRRPHTASILHEHHPSSAYATYNRRLHYL